MSTLAMVAGFHRIDQPKSLMHAGLLRHGTWTDLRPIGVSARIGHTSFYLGSLRLDRRYGR